VLGDEPASLVGLAARDGTDEVGVDLTVIGPCFPLLHPPSAEHRRLSRLRALTELDPRVSSPQTAVQISLLCASELRVANIPADWR